MTTREVYREIGDYDRMITCISNEASIRNFLKMFLDDDSFSILTEGLESGDAQRAFYGAHTLKGSCQNLCLGPLYETDYEITEALRVGDLEKARELYPGVKICYDRVIDQISRMDE